MKRLLRRAIPMAAIVIVAWVVPIPGLTPVAGAASTISKPSFQVGHQGGDGHGEDDHGHDDTGQHEYVESIIESAQPAGTHVDIVENAPAPDGQNEAPSAKHEDHDPHVDSDEHHNEQGHEEHDHDGSEEAHSNDAAHGPPPDPEDLVVGEGEVDAGFHTIGVTLEVESPVFLRVQGSDGEWQEWMELGIDPNEAPDTTSDEHTDDLATPPVFVEQGAAYEIVVSEEASDGADVVTVRDTTEWKVAVTDTQAAAATDTPFSMHTRGEWTSRAPREVNVASAVNMAIVHHTVNPNGYSPGSVPSMLRGIQNYHMDGRGWSDIGYNFVVDKFGGIWEARGGGYDRPVIGAHAAGFNTGAVGISVLGDYTAVNPSAATNESIAQVAGWKLFRHGHDPAQTATFTSAGGPRFAAGTRVNLPRVLGHTNVGSTSCPGSIANYLPGIRARAQQVADFLQAVLLPLGGLDSVQVNGLTISAVGWAIDPDLGGPARVDLRAGSVTRNLTANIPRPDLAGQHTAYSTNRGFSGSVTADGAGLQDYCITVINQGIGVRDLPLSCGRTRFTDPSGRSPTGDITWTGFGYGVAKVSADFIDPDTTGGSYTALELNGRQVATAGAVRHVDFVVPGTPGGFYEACVVVKNTGAGVDSRIDCTDIVVPGSSPIGAVTSITNPAKGWIRVRGWALDPETLDPIDVVAITGRKWTVAPANVSSADVVSPHPWFGNDHGFDFYVPTGVGVHDTCIVATNVGAGAPNTLTCGKVTVK